MPRMPGQCFDERSILKALGPDDRRGVAIALGEMLAEMQTLTGPFAGDFDVTSIALESYRDGYTKHVVDETLGLVRTAQARGASESEDIAWIEKVAAMASDVAGVRRPNTFVHGDYKLNNLTVMNRGGWRVSGVFDLHGARFGDGALDVVRQTCSYLDTDIPLARVFFERYRATAPSDPTLGERLPLYVANDRMGFWEFFTRPDARAEWTRGRSFRSWAQRYSDAILKLL
jgi:aminoglycoside phosphotransferase (APT) family kinase protein